MSGRESLVLGVAALCSLAIMGWIVWTERPAPPPAPSTQTSATTAPEAPAGPDPQEVDQQRVADLVASAESSPDDPLPRASLGHLYFDAQRFDEAISWYEQVLELDPADLAVSTNLGVSYYYGGQTERSISAFEHALEVDPSHQRALLSLGIVKAFGLQDLDGAIAAWEQVVAIAPDSPEGLAAQDSLERIRGAHGATGNDSR